METAGTAAVVVAEKAVAQPAAAEQEMALLAADYRVVLKAVATIAAALQVAAAKELSSRKTEGAKAEDVAQVRLARGQEAAEPGATGGVTAPE